MTLHAPEEQDVSGTTLEKARGWYLVWLMVPEVGMGRLGCDGRCPADNRWRHRDVYVSGEARIAGLSMAERCSSEPCPGSGLLRTGPDAGAVAIRAFSCRRHSAATRDYTALARSDPSRGGPFGPLARHVCA